jgi:hypothetical protein
MTDLELSAAESFNPWSVVNVVFHHLVDNGLHPVLAGNPNQPAADLLRALGIQPGPENSEQGRQDIDQHLADLRVAVVGERP